jgi:hypothetical protein
MITYYKEVLISTGTVLNIEYGVSPLSRCAIFVHDPFVATIDDGPRLLKQWQFTSNLGMFPLLVERLFTHLTFFGLVTILSIEDPDVGVCLIMMARLGGWLLLTSQNWWRGDST